ncbi:hypothetical protein DEJ25_03465 [Curtobacterium sp. MCPF17_011]|nr:hypothetical protein DEJ25_03465 [Curtobacterium sp. MCPF17_011]
MIRCEHCGSALPDGAIFCGECGRAVTTSAARRTAPVEAADRATPPPLQQPDAHGRVPETGDDAWLPESTLDPATRAWLTGADRARPAPAAAGSVGAGAGDAPDASSGSITPRPDLTPRGAPSHVHGAGTGLGDWTGRPAGAETPTEPTLDPDAFPSEAVAPQDDPEVQRTAAWAPLGTDAADSAGPSADVPVWEPQTTTAAPPAGPSWWVGRAPSAAVAATQTSSDDADGSSAGEADDAPRPGDTAAFQPVLERRAPRPAPLVAPGSQSATCHVCGHALEPDDIFCEECGSVRPAVTAAFTGPVMPLPLTRPDWAADEDALRSAVSDAHELTEDRDGAGGPSTHQPVVDEPVADEPVADEPVPDETVVDGLAADQHDPVETAAGEPVVDDAGGALAEAQDSDPAHSDSDSSDVTVDQEALIPSAAPLPPVAPRQPPVAAPLPPVGLPDEAADGGAPVDPVFDADEDEDVEETRIVSRTADHAPFLLHFSTGERLGVHGSALLGRLPRPEAGERFDDLLTIRDPGKSVSKTHLELGRDGDDLWVSDRYSGNGTVVRHIDGSIRRCEPGRRYRVERGARVDVGEQFFLLQ